MAVLETSGTKPTQKPKPSRPWVFSFKTAFGILLLVSVFQLTPIYSRIQLALNDWRWMGAQNPELADPRVVIVAIDQKSIDYCSSVLRVHWPWPRQFHAMILDYFTLAGASGVLFDITLSEPEVGRLDVPGGTSDSEFAAAIAASGRTILTAFLEDVSDTDPGGAKTAAAPARAGGETRLRMKRPLDLYCRSGAEIGISYLDSRTEIDGICRALPLVYELEEGIFPQLAFAAYLKVTGDRFERYDSAAHVVITRDRTFKLDRRNLYTIRWYGKGAENGVFRYDSYHAVLQSAVQIKQGLEPTIPLADYTGKVVIVLGTAPSLVDDKTTPFSTLGPYPGGEIHATLLSNLLRGHGIVKVPNWIVVALTFPLIILLTLWILTRPVLFSVFASTLVAGILWSFNNILFAKVTWDFDVLAPLTGIILTVVFTSSFRVLSEANARRKLRQVFARYMDEDAIQVMMQDPDRIDLDGQAVASATVLFTDLQGFTTFSEGKGPHEILEALNAYFDKVTTVVLDQGGLLDKYTGDGVMAIFGAPRTHDHHARDACEAVLSFQEQEINSLIRVPGGTILTRVGVCTGPIVVGNLGSSRRMDYTAIGDTVNLAARLEGINKAYGTTNIVGESTAKAVTGYFFREMDRIRVKGKYEPISIYTLLGREREIPENQRIVEEQFQKALAVYRARDWIAAGKAFEQVLKLDPNDGPARAFVERCRRLVIDPTLVDPDGVYTFRIK